MEFKLVMHRSMDDHNPYNMLIFTKDYTKNFTTRYMWFLTIGQMAMFVV